MAQSGTCYVCAQCGAQAPKWQGRCPGCGAWNTLAETIVEKGGAQKHTPRAKALAPTAALQRLSDIEPEENARVPTGIAEFDRPLGGGLVPGGVVLIGGDPGIGKSTLLLQALAKLSQDFGTLYASGEESASQIALRAQRLGVGGSQMALLAESHLEKVLGAIASQKPQIVVIDSIQTLWSEALSSAPGSVAQVRQCAAELTRTAKETGASLVLVGHVTKEGALAGPRVLEHIVDTVLYFEGDTHSRFRLIRAFKNRFGAVNELGVFAMTETGLKGVSNPSAIFLSQHGKGVPGTAILATQEGTRPLLVEIQALVDAAHGNPRRLTVGLDAQRLAMLLAVLHRHAGLATFDQDVFLNAVGGVKINEPAADLAALLAIVSSLQNRALPDKLIVFGEVGLAGEIRPAPRGQERLREAAKLGFTRALVPTANLAKTPVPGIEAIGVSRIGEAVGKLREIAG
jgi:DNA repair protein RadA/Sms